MPRSSRRIEEDAATLLDVLRRIREIILGAFHSVEGLRSRRNMAWTAAADDGEVQRCRVILTPRKDKHSTSSTVAKLQ